MSYFKRLAWVAPLVLLLASCGGHSHAERASGSQAVTSGPVDQNQVKVTQLNLKDDGTIPNNPKFSVLLYHGAFKGLTTDQIRKTFVKNNWGNNWVDGVFDFHHFHSNTHEVLGFAAGSGEIQLGGPKGQIVKVQAGDVAVLPAGTGHKRISASSDFSVVGGYPDGKDYDIETKETRELKANIAKVGKPDQDPVYGVHGPLSDAWPK